MDLLEGVNLGNLHPRLYYSEAFGRRCIDCQATAIKNATVVNFVGERFLREVVNDYFLDRPIVPPSVRREVKEKYYFDAARAIINAPASNMYPENCHLLPGNTVPRTTSWRRSGPTGWSSNNGRA